VAFSFLLFHHLCSRIGKEKKINHHTMYRKQQQQQQ